MKKIFALISAIGLCSILTGQTYNPLIENGKSWNVLTSTMAEYFTSTYFLHGDTLIEGTTYQKLYEKSKYYGSGNYAGAIREETTTREVYFRGSSETSEKLLYDFSLQVGDTVSIMSYSGWKGFQLTFRVDSADQVLDENGLTRRRMFLDDLSFKTGEIWVEGIGSMQGLISPGNLFYMADLNWQSLCTSIDENPVYYNPVFDTCTYDLVGIPDLTHDPAHIRIFPNPVSGISVLEVDGNSKGPITIEVLDITGHAIKKETAGSNRFLINNQDYPPGLYLIKATDNDQVNVVSKFIIR
jgi:hypothetical protein